MTPAPGTATDSGWVAAPALTTAGATVVLADVEAALDGRATCFGVVRESVGEVLAAAVTRADELPR